MEISTSFPGGNIRVIKIEGDTVVLKNELRDTKGDWFYWAFCVRGAGGRTITFRFDEKKRVGYWGGAVSHDLLRWNWSGSRHVYEDGTESFTYTFGQDENLVYFAHDMYYSTDRHDSLAARLGMKKFPFATSPKGRVIYAYEMGEGEDIILMTARHHACESPGNYMIEGILCEFSEEMPKGYRVLTIPFVDLDGVIEGDQGKNRAPHDHNRDYTDAPIYDVCRKIMELKVAAAFDFHAPDHLGGRRSDFPFVARSNTDDNAWQERFCNLLIKASSGLPMSYDATHDAGAGAGWNSSQTPNFKNHFLKNSSLKTSITFETPYFGFAGSEFTEENATAFGRAFGRAIRDYLSSGTV